MEGEIALRIVLENPTFGVDFGLQQGKGANYQVLQKQRAIDNNLLFDFFLKVKRSPQKNPIFLGALAHGTPKERFVYINIGASAGQINTVWNRRLKIPLSGITWEMLARCQADTQVRLEIHVPGKGKDGTPNCGGYKMQNSWKLVK